MSKIFRKLIHLIGFIGLPLLSIGQIKTSKLISDHMVLQRDMALPIWGWDEPGTLISIKFNDQSYDAVTADNGKWQVNLAPQKAGGPFSMKISNGKTTLTYQDILVGDVWVCSGQSNMAWTIANSNNAKEEIAQATDGQIRHFEVPRIGSQSPEPELPGGTWQVTSAETVASFSAVGYFFARHLREKIGVPIGLINSSWGGSRIEAWTRKGTKYPPGISKDIQQSEAKRAESRDKVIAKLKATYGHLPKEDQGMKGEDALWAASNLSEEDWDSMELPGLWESKGLDGLDGIVWFRKSFELKKLPTGMVEIGLAKIDDSDQVWINNQPIGGMTQSYNTVRKYIFSSELLKPGQNNITVRVEDTGGGGGIYGDAALLYLKTKDQTISLAGTWKTKIGAYFEAAVNQRVHHTPTMLYNKMIHPMIGYGIKGVIWYQGESNAGGQDAFSYRGQFPAMIEDWRAQWQIGDFPFLFVQLANFREPVKEPSPSDWAVLRESQSFTLTNCKNTGQAVIIDIGEANDIHPRNKQDVGYRLGLAAQKLAYDQDLVYSGPVFKKVDMEDKRAILSFDHIGGGLVAKDKYGYLKGFTIAGADQKFYWAQAKIENNRVIVWSDQVSTPKAVRYGWADNPDDANLYNQEGLPASPFRTDQWK